MYKGQFNRDRGKSMCHAAGILSPTEEEVSHMTALLAAFEIYRDRTAEYGQLWRASGAMDNAMHVKSKAQRMLAGLHTSIRLDSALDAINYAVFYFLNTRDGND